MSTAFASHKFLEILLLFTIFTYILGEFRWANSGEHLQFVNWNSNEPANTENDDCVFMTADHKWNNHPCPELKPALCQRRYIFA